MKFLQTHPKKKIVGLLFGGLFAIWLVLQFPNPWNPTLGEWLQERFGNEANLKSESELNADGSFDFFCQLGVKEFTVQDNWAVDLVENVFISPTPGVQDWWRQEFGVEPVASKDLFVDATADIAAVDDFRVLAKEDLDSIRDWIGFLNPKLDKLAKATRKPNFVFPLDRSGKRSAGQVVSMLLWETSGYNALYLAFKTRAKIRILDGKYSDAIEDIQTLLRIARSLRKQHFFVGASRALAMKVEVLKLAGDWLVSEPGELGVRQYKLIAEELSRHFESDSLFQRYHKNQQRILFDWLQFFRYGEPKSVGIDPTLKGRIFGEFWNLDWSVVAEAVEDHLQNLNSAWANEDRVERLSALQELLERNEEEEVRLLENRWRNYISCAARSHAAGHSFVLSESIDWVSVILDTENRDLECELRLRVLIVALLAKAYSASQGSWPTTELQLKSVFDELDSPALKWSTLMNPKELAPVQYSVKGQRSFQIEIVNPFDQSVYLLTKGSDLVIGFQ